MNRIRRHRRKIRAQERCAARHDHGIEQTVEHRQRAVNQAAPVLGQVHARNQREAARQVRMGSGGIYKKNHKPEQAQEGEDDKHHIGDGPSYVHSAAARSICVVVHTIIPPSLQSA